MASIEGITDAAFRQLLSVISEWYDKRGYINMLKVLYRDNVKNTHELNKASRTIELMDLLIASGNLHSTDSKLLYDTIMVTDQFGLEWQIKDKLSSFQKNRDVRISKFKTHRQKIIKLGMTLIDDDIVKISELYNEPVKKYTDTWSLIIDLEHRMIIHEGKMDEFVESLNTLNLPRAVAVLTEDINQKESSSSEQEHGEDIHLRFNCKCMHKESEVHSCQKDPLVSLNDVVESLGYLKAEDIPKFSKQYKNIAKYLKKKGLEIKGVNKGSMIFHLSVSDPNALENLWEMHKNGELIKDMAELLVADEHQEQFINRWWTEIDEIEYKAALIRLQEKGTACSRSIVFHLSVSDPNALENLCETNASGDLIQDLAEVLVPADLQDEFVDRWSSELDEQEYQGALSKLKANARKLTQASMMAEHLSATNFIGISDEQFRIVGREKQIKNLKEIFMDTVVCISSQQRPNIQVILITGEPMIGKTRLSKEIGHQLVRDCHQSRNNLDAYFIELRRVTDFSTVLVRLSAALGMPPCTEYDIIKVFRRRKHSCLLIFDSAEHLSVDTSAELQTQFLEFCTRLVNHSKVLLLITSRFQYRLLSIRAKVYHHRLKPLSLEESSDLLKSIAMNIVFTDEIDKKIADLCAGIPLALEIAATELQDNSYTPKELVELLENDRLEALSADNYSQEEQVRHVIKSSVDKLRDILRKEYVKLSYIPSSFNADAVAYILELHDSKAALAKRDVLIPLTTRSLVARDTLHDRFDIHDFLREYLSDDLSSLPLEQLLSLRNRYCVFYGRLLQALAPVVEEDSCKKLPLFTVEIVNIQKLLYEAALCPTEDYDLFLDIACKAEYLIINFLPRRESVEFYAACVWAAESRKKTKHLGLMLSSYGQALNFTKSDWKVAQEQYERAQYYLAPFGDSVDLAWLLNHIGWNLHMQGIRRKALKYFTDAEKTLMRMSEADKNGDTRWKRILASVWSCIGISYVVLDEPERGIEYHEKVLKMRRKLWGDHPSIGGTYNNISLAYIRMGDEVKALSYSEKGLDTKTRFNKEPANDIIVSLNNVAINICLYKNDPAKAHKLLDRSFKMRESLGLRHVDTALIANNRGRVYEYEGNYSEAMKCYEKAVRIRENLQGQHESTARALYNVASLKMKLNKLDDALKFFNKCYEMRKHVWTGNHRSTQMGEVMESLGKLHERRNEIREAEKYLSESLDEFGRLKKLFEEQGGVRQIKEIDACIARIRENLQPINRKLSTILNIEGAQKDSDENDDGEQDDHDVNRLNEQSFTNSCTRQNKCKNGGPLEGLESPTVKSSNILENT